jgi:hypothetical protein
MDDTGLIELAQTRGEDVGAGAKPNDEEVD